MENQLRPEKTNSTQSKRVVADAGRSPIHRRSFVVSVVSGAVVGLAGCVGDGDDEDVDDDVDEHDEIGAEVETALDVSTGEATEVGATSATLTGEIVVLSGIDEATVGFELRAVDDDDERSVDAGTVAAAEPFEATTEELDSETEYEFRATAVSDELSTEGEFVSFTTEELEADHTIRVHGVEFTPDELTIEVGETVEWVFEGGGHNVFVSEAPEESDWDGTEGTGTHPQGHVHKHRFTVPGTYEYNCSPHSHLGMEGTIEVTE